MVQYFIKVLSASAGMSTLFSSLESTVAVFAGQSLRLLSTNPTRMHRNSTSMGDKVA